MIRQQRQFYPFGAVLAGGEVEPVSGDLGHPWSGTDELRDLLWETLDPRLGEGHVDAAAVAVDTGKAIEVEIRPRAGASLLVTQPYRRKRLGGDVAFDPPTVGPVP